LLILLFAKPIVVHVRYKHGGGTTIIEDLKSMLFALLQVLPALILLSVFAFESNDALYSVSLCASYVIFGIVGLALYFILRKFSKSKLLYTALSFFINLAVIIVIYKILSTAHFDFKGLILVFDLYAFAIYTAIILIDLVISLIRYAINSPKTENA